MFVRDEECMKFHRRFRRRPHVFSGAPGRINLIGEHTDYNLGYVLPAAIDRRTNFLAARRDDDTVRIWTNDFRQEKKFSLHDLEVKSDCRWLDYVKGIFWVLKKKGCGLHGMDGWIWGNIPMEAGLSSSAALEVSILFALNRLYGLDLSKKEIVSLAQSVENDFIGLESGLMDQFISVFGRADHALFLDCMTLKSRLLPLRLKRNDLCVLVYNSGVRRELSGSEYNQRRKESSAAIQKLSSGGIDSFRRLTPEGLDRRRAGLGDLLFRRARHIVTENMRVEKAVEALRNDDFFQMGRLLFQSHRSLRDDYEVSCPELDLLYAFGLEFDGCLGARLTGAGFGGSGIVLLKRERIESFERRISRLAAKKGFPSPGFYKVEIGNGAAVENME